MCQQNEWTIIISANFSRRWQIKSQIAALALCQPISFSGCLLRNFLRPQTEHIIYLFIYLLSHWQQANKEGRTNGAAYAPLNFHPCCKLGKRRRINRRHVEIFLYALLFSFAFSSSRSAIWLSSIILIWEIWITTVGICAIYFTVVCFCVTSTDLFNKY